MLIGSRHQSYWSRQTCRDAISPNFGAYLCPSLKSGSQLRFMEVYRQIGISGTNCQALPHLDIRISYSPKKAFISNFIDLTRFVRNLH